MFKSTFIFALAKAKRTRHAHSKCLQQLCNQLYNFLVTYTTSDVQASFTQAASIYGRPAANSSTVTLHGLHRVCFFTAGEEHYFSLAFPQLPVSFSFAQKVTDKGAVGTPKIENRVVKNCGCTLHENMHSCKGIGFSVCLLHVQSCSSLCTTVAGR